MYKVEKYIDKCIQSILQQTYTNYEAIFVDDGSPDQCGVMLDLYAKISNKIKVIHQNNAGVAEARNSGIKAAQGEYIVFVDADDYVEPCFLENLLLPFNDNSIQLSIINYSVNGKKAVREKTGVYSKIETSIKFFTRKSFMGYLFNKMFLTSIVKENNILFDPESHWCEDALFCAQYAKHISYSYYTDAPGYNYCVREDSATQLKFNHKHFSVLNTYKKIISIMNECNDRELTKRLKVNYLIHCINLKRMISERHGHDGLYLNEIDSHLSSNMSLIFSRYMPMKDKIKYILYSLRRRKYHD
ncbi:glycosyltransferase family 2 protein [Macellibacteroides fermentans]|uniref:glycosyltransferase family 2 protein n=1 Tax=Macellibacteroides fermentans TaxID=879969 RepID=UPI00406CD507